MWVFPLNSVQSCLVLRRGLAKGKLRISGAIDFQMKVNGKAEVVEFLRERKWK